MPRSSATLSRTVGTKHATEPRISLTPGRADNQGNYTFSGLAPGNYRVISSRRDTPPPMRKRD